MRSKGLALLLAAEILFGVALSEKCNRGCTTRCTSRSRPRCCCSSTAGTPILGDAFLLRDESLSSGTIDFDAESGASGRSSSDVFGGTQAGFEQPRVEIQIQSQALSFQPVQFEQGGAGPPAAVPPDKQFEGDQLSFSESQLREGQSQQEPSTQRHNQFPRQNGPQIQPEGPVLVPRDHITPRGPAQTVNQQQNQQGFGQGISFTAVQNQQVPQIQQQPSGYGASQVPSDVFGGSPSEARLLPDGFQSGRIQQQSGLTDQEPQSRYQQGGSVPGGTGQSVSQQEQQKFGQGLPSTGQHQQVSQTQLQPSGYGSGQLPVVDGGNSFQSQGGFSLNRYQPSQNEQFQGQFPGGDTSLNGSAQQTYQEHRQGHGFTATGGQHQVPQSQHQHTGGSNSQAGLSSDVFQPQIQQQFGFTDSQVSQPRQVSVSDSGGQSGLSSDGFQNQQQIEFTNSQTSGSGQFSVPDIGGQQGHQNVEPHGFPVQRNFQPPGLQQASDGQLRQRQIPGTTDSINGPHSGPPGPTESQHGGQYGQFQGQMEQGGREKFNGHKGFQMQKGMQAAGNGYSLGQVGGHSAADSINLEPRGQGFQHGLPSERGRPNLTLQPGSFGIDAERQRIGHSQGRQTGGGHSRHSERLAQPGEQRPEASGFLANQGQNRGLSGQEGFDADRESVETSSGHSQHRGGSLQQQGRAEQSRGEGSQQQGQQRVQQQANGHSEHQVGNNFQTSTRQIPNNFGGQDQEVEPSSVRNPGEDIWDSELEDAEPFHGNNDFGSFDQRAVRKLSQNQNLQQGKNRNGHNGRPRTDDPIARRANGKQKFIEETDSNLRQRNTNRAGPRSRFGQGHNRGNRRNGQGRSSQIHTTRGGNSNPFGQQHSSRGGEGEGLPRNRQQQNASRFRQTTERRFEQHRPQRQLNSNGRNGLRAQGRDRAGQQQERTVSHQQPARNVDQDQQKQRTPVRNRQFNRNRQGRQQIRQQQPINGQRRGSRHQGQQNKLPTGKRQQGGDRGNHQPRNNGNERPRVRGNNRPQQNKNIGQRDQNRLRQQGRQQTDNRAVGRPNRRTRNQQPGFGRSNDQWNTEFIKIEQGIIHKLPDIFGQVRRLLNLSTDLKSLTSGFGRQPKLT